MSIISASTTSTTGYVVTSDTTGTLVFKTGASPTTAMTLGSDQSVTFAGAQTYTGAASFTTGITVQGLTVGKGAGAVATNTAVGASALNANTTGARNTALGNLALAGNTTTTYSDATAIGYNALYQGGGGKSTAVGAGALSGELAAGGTNTAVGYNALTSDSSGGSNVAIGVQALQANTTASNNTAVGYQAAYNNTTGEYIDALGYSALRANTTGVRNTGIGTSAIGSNTTGSYNVGVGFNSLGSNTTASNNTAVGYQAGYSSTTGASNAFFGYQAGNAVTTGSQNTYLGYSAGLYMTTGNYNTIVGRFTGNQGGLDIRTASSYIVLSDGEGNPRMYYSTAGGTWVSAEIYASTTASAANMMIAASGTINRSTSALKYKQNIRDVEDFDISLLRPVRYNSKCENDDQTKDHLGLIADEAAEAGFEELVTRNEAGEVEGFQYERLTVVLLKKLQTLDAEFQAYKATHP